MDKIQVVWDDGIYLTYIHTGKYILNLFQVEDFYVEIFYDTNEDRVVFINTFNHLSPLDKYLGQITVDLDD